MTGKVDLSWMNGLTGKEKEIETNPTQLLTKMSENSIPQYPCMTVRTLRIHTEKKEKRKVNIQQNIIYHVE